MKQASSWFANKSSEYYLGAIMLCAFLFRAALDIVRPYSAAHADEIFQVLEPAHRVATGYGMMSWEWTVGMRSWILPCILAPVIWLGNAFHIGSLANTTILRLLFSAVSIIWIPCVYIWARRIAGNAAGLTAAAIVAFSPEIAVIASHTLNDDFGVVLLLPSLVMLFGLQQELTRRQALFSGFLLGFAIMLRIQLSLVLVYVAIYVLLRRKEIAKQFFIGIAIACAVFGIIDWISWGIPFASIVLYVRENLFYIKENTVDRRANVAFGTSPWYWYFQNLFTIFGPFLLLAIPAARRARHPAIMAAIIILCHSAIGHKESRYMTSAYPLLAILIAVGIADAVRWFADRKPEQTALRTRIAWTTACICLFAMAGYRLAVLHIGGAFPQTILFYSLSKRTDICGVELETSWGVTDGYTALNQPVPVVEYENSTPIGSLDKYANYRVAFAGLPRADYVPVECFGDNCIYKRPGTCAVPDEKITLNYYHFQQPNIEYRLFK